MSEPTEYKKLTINVAPALYEELEAMAADEDVTVTELFRRAVALYKFVNKYRNCTR